MEATTQKQYHRTAPTIRETEKAVLLRVAFIYNDDAIYIDLPTGENLPGHFLDVWVPKSCIIDGRIAEWFVRREIAPKFFKGNWIMNKSFIAE